MTTTIYTADLGFDTIRFRADLSQASAPITLVNDEGEETATQYQTADARHDVRQALMLAIGACGRDYYAQPDDNRGSDEIIAELVEVVDIESEEG